MSLTSRQGSGRGWGSPCVRRQKLGARTRGAPLGQVVCAVTPALTRGSRPPDSWGEQNGWTVGGALASEQKYRPVWETGQEVCSHGGWAARGQGPGAPHPGSSTEPAGTGVWSGLETWGTWAPKAKGHVSQEAGHPRSLGSDVRGRDRTPLCVACWAPCPRGACPLTPPRGVTSRRQETTPWASPRTAALGAQLFESNRGAWTVLFPTKFRQ